MSPSNSASEKIESTLATNDCFWFRSSATWTRKARHGTKIPEQ